MKSHMSKAVSHSFSTRGVVHRRGLYLFVKKIEACSFQWVNMNPSMNACQPIRFCAIIADKRETDVQLGMLPILSLYMFSWFTVISTVFRCVWLSMKFCSGVAMEAVHLSVASLILHPIIWILSSVSLHSGKILSSLNFQSFILISVPQKSRHLFHHPYLTIKDQKFSSMFDNIPINIIIFCNRKPDLDIPLF